LGALKASIISMNRERSRALRSALSFFSFWIHHHSVE
jgi:hypothetical protein